MNKIVIIGSGGAGKSTLACRLGGVLGIEVIHLDRLYWQPGWIATPQEEWVDTVRELVSRDRWIIDGNYGASMETRLSASDTIIFLDFSRSACFRQIIKRWLRHRGSTRPDMTPGCCEKIDFEFARWIWQFPKRNRPFILGMIEKHSDGREVIMLRNQREVSDFLDRLRSVSALPA